jgi:hypothetical protein
LQVQGLVGMANPPEDVYYRFVAPTDHWEEVTVPLATLGIQGKTNCTGFWIQLTPGVVSNAVFYVDDVKFNASRLPAVAEATASVQKAPDLASPGSAGVGNWSVAVWCIVGALGLMAGLLGWLVLLLRRNGLGGSKALVRMSGSVPAATGPGRAAGALSAEGAATEVFADPQTQQLRERVATELAEFAKQSLVQGLYAQKSQLMETQQKAQEELAALEARLAMLKLPLTERIRAYELRINELEKQLETRDEEMRDMIETTLLLVRQRLEKEKEKEKLSGRFN